MPGELAKRVRAKYPGTYDDIDDATLEAKVKAKYPGVYDDLDAPTDPPAGATQGMLPQSTEQGDPDDQAGGMSDARWAGLTPAQKAQNVLQWGGKAISGAFGMGSAGRDAVETPAMTLATAGAPMAFRGVKAAVPGVSQAAQKVGTLVKDTVARPLGISGARAAENMQAASQAAKDVPVQTGKVMPGVTRARELQATGSRMPRVVQQLERRVGQAADGSLSFQEASDFTSSLSRLSPNDYNALNPQMHRQIIAIQQAMREALTDAAEQVGRGEQYAQGVKEYAKSARAAERWEKLKPQLMKTMRRIGYAAVAGAGYGASRQ